jgi:hypothetical protein
MARATENSLKTNMLVAGRESADVSKVSRSFYIARINERMSEINSPECGIHGSDGKVRRTPELKCHLRLESSLERLKTVQSFPHKGSQLFH